MFITWHTRGQISMNLVWTIEFDSLRWLAAGSRLIGILPQCQESLFWITMAWAMAPVESVGFCSREGEGEGGADLRRVWWVLVAQVSSAGRFLGVGGVLVEDDSMPRQCCGGWRKSAGSSLGIFAIIRIAPYLILLRSFGGKPDDNRPNRWDGVGRNIGAAWCPGKVGSSRWALCGASEKLLWVEVGQTGRSVGRRPHASLQRAVRTSFVHTDEFYFAKRLIKIYCVWVGNKTYSFWTHQVYLIQCNLWTQKIKVVISKIWKS